MAAVVERGDNAVHTKEHSKPEVVEAIIPDIIEERRKDSEGRIVTNQFMRGKMLGKGGFAKVYLGLLMPHKTHYALKIVAKSSLVKSRAKAKLQTEIKIHRSLRHVNIVKFERYFEDHDHAYILLELCNHNSMSELIKRRKKLSEAEARFYLSQIISSLLYLHENLVIHRDLKLGNLFIGADMKIKVGDFGLATKLTHYNERRKTICGTPNYIAPEILEGKEGHSFPVDTWSTGVILYTLLIGKPPFESKDVKSTYKRILANSFSYPEHTPISHNSKKLIGELLQAKPENRPLLTRVLDHPFFTSYTPLSLPESAMRECPTEALLRSIDSTTHSRSHNDENENYTRNFSYNTSDSKKLPSKSSSSPYGQHGDAQQSSTNPREILKPKNLNTMSQPQSSRLNDYNLPTTAKTQPSHPYQSRSHSTQSSQGSTSQEGIYDDLSNAHTGGHVRSTSRSNPHAAHPGVSSDRVSSSNSNNQKFDIYMDKQTTSQSQSSRPYTGSSQPAPTSGKSRHLTPSSITASHSSNAADGSKKHGYGDSRQRRTQSSSSGSGINGDVERIQSELECIDINGTNDKKAKLGDRDHNQNRKLSPSQQAQTGYGAYRKSSSSSTSTSSGDNKAASSSQAREAWSWEKDAEGSAGSISNSNGGSKPAFPPSTAVARPSTAHPTGSGAGSQLFAQSAAAERTHSAGSTTTTSLALLSARPDMRSSDYEHGSSSEPMCLGTPPDQIISSKNKQQVALGTLETMHEMLNTSFSIIEQQGCTKNTFQEKQLETEDQSRAKRSDDLEHLVAKIWVVRYVDYTSKYGLGFLFNNGSAGVYFNDSTKIVLSSDGSTFQYIERRKKDARTVMSGSEHCTQTHAITHYPLELQKKVTLLKHFRNYLVDQQKNTKNGDGGSGTGEDLGTNPGLIRDGLISEGASSQVSFGTSSCRYTCQSKDRAESDSEDAAGDQEMPFLKKWVRTKHAILFRISNRTVQVVFYDRSEILLSSEARIITYVNKQGVRTEHSLDQVLVNGRLDIAKRLKYTKDIMYRLISTQAK